MHNKTEITMAITLTNIPAKPRIFVLTGAGISAESGLATFRGEDGLWEGHRVEDVATPEAYEQNPSLVHTFYNLRRTQLTSDSVNPNAAHRALAALQSVANERLNIVTQNVDDLHDRLNPNVLHMHGELLKSFCTKCQFTFEHNNNISPQTRCQQCNAAGTTRPDIVWFGEMPKHMAQIDTYLGQCDVFIAIGTSGHVYPAAGFVQQAKYHGALTIEVNIDSSEISPAFDQHYIGTATAQVPLLVKALTAHY